jgi:hypothetical protein
MFAADFGEDAFEGLSLGERWELLDKHLFLPGLLEPAFYPKNFHPHHLMSTTTY